MSADRTAPLSVRAMGFRWRLASCPYGAGESTVGLAAANAERSQQYERQRRDGEGSVDYHDGQREVALRRPFGGQPGRVATGQNRSCQADHRDPGAGSLRALNADPADRHGQAQRGWQHQGHHTVPGQLVVIRDQVRDPQQQAAACYQHMACQHRRG
jgi:hypothetical protein